MPWLHRLLDVEKHPATDDRVRHNKRPRSCELGDGTKHLTTRRTEAVPQIASPGDSINTGYRFTEMRTYPSDFPHKQIRHKHSEYRPEVQDRVC